MTEKKHEKTEWTDRIKSAGEKAFKVGERAYVSARIDPDEMGGIIDDLLKVSQEMDAEIARLNNILGTKATEEDIEASLNAFGNAYIYKGRLLDPVDLVIKVVKRETSENEAMAIVKALHDLYFENGEPKEPPMDMDGIAKDGLAMLKILSSVQQLVGPGIEWERLTKRTNDPKLSWLELKLTEAGIAHRRNGRSFHAPIMEVDKTKIDEAWEILTPVDDVDDDDPRFAGCACTCGEDDDPDPSKALPHKTWCPKAGE